MSLFVHVLRFVVGISLVAGGAVLAQPFAKAVMAVRHHADVAGRGAVPMELQRPAVPNGTPAAGGDIGGQADAWLPVPQPMQGSPGMACAPGMPCASPPTGFAQPVEGFQGPGAAAMPPSRPAPPAPAPLPRAAAGFAQAPPDLDGAYRSTLDIPPPPLLDTQSPPPLAVGWSANDVPRPAVPAGADSGQPSTYVVRDGDDLTGIALRVYGSAGAASAIWAANRDRLQDPQLLPIGMMLRMPPSWTLPSAHAGQAGAGRAIEPSFGGAGTASASWRTARPSAVEQRANGMSAWLQPGDGEAVRQTAEPAPANRNGPPATLRVAEGDSLESIAVRFYGDRTAAARIWQANRDRLRSPDLLVPGIELRLP